MKRKGAKRQWKGALPSSGELIGVLARLVDWKPRQAARDSTWRKFIHGQSISEATRDAILKEIAEDFVKPEKLRTPTGELIPAELVKEELHRVLRIYVSWWDELLVRLQTAIPTEPTPLINMAALRLVVVELAVRISAFCARHGLRAEPAAEPERFDIQELLLPMVLREGLKSAGITRMELAAELVVSKEAVDQWLARDMVVRVEVLDDIAEVVAERAGKDPVMLSTVLRVIRGLTQVLLGIRDRIDQEEANHILQELVWLTQLSLAALNAQMDLVPEPERSSILETLMVVGSDYGPGPLLRKAMLEREKDDSWRGVIAVSPEQWDHFLANVLATEKAFADTRHLASQQGFKYLLMDDEEMRMARMVKALVPLEEHLPAPIARVLKGPVADPQQLLDFAGWLLQQLLSDERRPDAWRLLMKHAEFCRFHMARTEGAEERTKWAILSWSSYGLGLDKVLKEWPELTTPDGLQSLLAWFETTREALDALPPFPEQVDPALQPVIEHVKKAKDAFSHVHQLEARIRETLSRLETSTA
jgi:transcriptional regulator with XRE-family HTH domain